MVFVKGQKPNKGRTKPRIGRKIKGMNKNAKQTAYYAANSWTTFAKSCLIITLLTVNQNGDLCVKMARERHLKPPSKCIRHLRGTGRPDKDFNPLSDAAKRNAIAVCYCYDYDA